MAVEIVQLVTRISDERGELGILEDLELPFGIHRTYWITDIPAGEVRGNHAHKELNQAFLMVKGNATLVIRDGARSVEYFMTTDSNVYLLPPGYWRELKDFSSDAVLMVCADKGYSESDYIRSWDAYLSWLGENDKQ
jgi:dTDP-4-dehydrorhamnose 3,5-epimerase-like enzyme